MSEKVICTRCRNHSYAFDSHFSVFHYSGIIREMIHRYKEEGYTRLVHFFYPFFSSTLNKEYPALPLIPVPCSKRSYKKRGWDQVMTLLELSDRKVLPLLHRDNGGMQKGLDREARKSNLKGKIHLKKRFSSLSVKNDLPEQVVLVDDVFTTGSTLHECAGVLKEQGVMKVFCITLAMD